MLGLRSLPGRRGWSNNRNVDGAAVGFGVRHAGRTTPPGIWDRGYVGTGRPDSSHLRFASTVITAQSIEKMHHLARSFNFHTNLSRGLIGSSRRGLHARKAP